VSRQGDKNKSASGTDSLKAVDIVSNHLTWTPEGAEHPILKDITLTLESGHIYGIIGPNGAGKSSFLRHVLAFLKTENKDSIKIGSAAASDYPRKKLAKLLSFVPQKTDIDTDFTAEEIVMTGRTPYQGRFAGATDEDQNAVSRAFSLTKADKLKEKKFAVLSGGEKQKIVIARAVAQTTPWMLLDEPIASLDIKNQIEIMQTLALLNRQEGVSVLMVLHDINLAGNYCDRLIMLKDGQVIAEGDAADCLNEENLKQLYDIDFFHMDTCNGKRYYFANMQ
jgi:iron complex transport system ATP-binding protein